MVEVVLYYNHSRGVDQSTRKALHDLLNLLLRNVLVRPRYSPLIEAGLMVRLHLWQENKCNPITRKMAEAIALTG